MADHLVVPVGDLIGSPGRDRPFAVTVPVSLDLGDSRVDGPMTVSGRVVGLIDAVEAELPYRPRLISPAPVVSPSGRAGRSRFQAVLSDTARRGRYAIEETRSTYLVPPATSSRWRSPRRLYAGRIAGDFAQPVEPT